MQIRPVEATLKHVDRRTEGLTDRRTCIVMITGAFRDYVNSPKNIMRHRTKLSSPKDREPEIRVPLD
jgi:hypothetical protein